MVVQLFPPEGDLFYMVALAESIKKRKGVKMKGYKTC